MTFSVTAPMLPHTALKTTSTDYHSDCRGCHVTAKATDWIPSCVTRRPHA